MARSGKCAKLFSDNGKNFVGASNEIKKLLEINRKPDEKLANYLAAEGIEWKFIPARSPNFGGLWEAALSNPRDLINIGFDNSLTIIEAQRLSIAGPRFKSRARQGSFEMTPGNFDSIRMSADLGINEFERTVNCAARKIRPPNFRDVSGETFISQRHFSKIKLTKRCEFGTPFGLKKLKEPLYSLKEKKILVLTDNCKYPFSGEAQKQSREQLQVMKEWIENDCIFKEFELKSSEVQSFTTQ
ncbi:integrase catalytic domain-containing protein [Trichonephila clavipes]|nr:integrase catalytic domain-containing protein [Trichonephila clavipes]